MAPRFRQECGWTPKTRHLIAIVTFAYLDDGVLLGLALIATAVLLAVIARATIRDLQHCEQYARSSTNGG